MKEDTNKSDIVKHEEKNQDLAERTRESRVYIPKVDIYEKDDVIYLLADIPGSDENMVEVTLDKNVLTIDARVKPERPDDYSLNYAEYGIGDFRRRFNISDEIDREKISATVKNGVLTLTMPKSAPAVSRKIEVQAV
jgi:HSP20 family molecular chaperone IbpA